MKDTKNLSYAGSIEQVIKDEGFLTMKRLNQKVAEVEGQSAKSIFRTVKRVAQRLADEKLLSLKPRKVRKMTVDAVLKKYDVKRIGVRTIRDLEKKGFHQVVTEKGTYFIND